MIRSNRWMQVQNIRHRARDREGRLSTAFSAAKAQLQEAMDLLANKEEEANLARSHMAELEEKAAVAVAKLIERDHQARWFERRLAEVLRTLQQGIVGSRTPGWAVCY